MADETWAGTGGVLLLATVKGYVFSEETSPPSTMDAPLQIIIDSVIAQVQGEIGCTIPATSYTSETVSGTGRTWLDLKHWPIITVTTVTDINSNTYTVGAANDYTVEDYCLRAPGGWAKGFKNFVVTYKAGRSVIPRDIIAVCYELIAAKTKQMRFSLQGEGSRNFPDGSVSYTAVDGGFTKAQLAILAKYKRPTL